MRGFFSPSTDREVTARWQKLLRIACPFLLLLLWEAMARLGILDRRFFPPPSEVLGTARQMVADGSLAKAVGDSLRRLAIGYAGGAMLGIVVGLWLGLSSWARALFEPWLVVIYPVPELAIHSLLVLIVGLGEAAIVTSASACWAASVILLRPAADVAMPWRRKS